MAMMNDKQLALAKIYSQSILGLAEKSGEADTVLDELNELVDAFVANPMLENFFASPIINTGVRAKSIEKMFRGRFSDLVVDSLQVLNRKGRLDLVRAIVETYRSQLETHRNIAEVMVTTAVPLTDSLRSTLIDVTNKRIGKQIRLVEKVDPAIVGGFIVRFGDEKIDASVAAQLSRISDAFVERASREIQGGRSLVA